MTDASSTNKYSEVNIHVTYNIDNSPGTTWDYASPELLTITPHPFQQEVPNVSSFPEKHYFTDLISTMS